MVLIQDLAPKHGADFYLLCRTETIIPLFEGLLQDESHRAREPFKFSFNPRYPGV